MARSWEREDHVGVTLGQPLVIPEELWGVRADTEQNKAIRRRLKVDYYRKAEWHNLQNHYPPPPPPPPPRTGTGKCFRTGKFKPVF